MKQLAVSIAAALCLGIAANAIAEPQTVLKRKGKEPELVDSARYNPAKKVYTVTITRKVISLKKKDVEYCKPPKPKNFDKLPTIPELEQIIEEYEGLWWDLQAFARIMPLYLQKAENKKAINLFQKINTDIEQEIPPPVQRLYWQAMMNDNRFADLEKILNETVKQSQSRETCAWAYVARGDTLVAQNKPKDGLIHGYLKTVLMFEDVKPCRKQALEKTIKTMEELGDPRVDRFKKQLQE